MVTLGNWDFGRAQPCGELLNGGVLILAQRVVSFVTLSLLFTVPRTRVRRGTYTFEELIFTPIYCMYVGIAIGVVVCVCVCVCVCVRVFCKTRSIVIND